MATSPVANPAFNKYAKSGAYHWRAIDPAWKNRFKDFSLTLLARYGVIADAIQGQDRQILEVGCGDGALCHLLARRGHRVTGCDLDDVGIRLAREHTVEQAYAHRPEFVVADLTVHDFAGRRFDYVAMADVVEHLENRDAVMSAAVRLTKPGGRILLTTPYRKPDGKWDRFHVLEYTDQELKAFLERYGDDVEVRCFHPMMLHRIYARRALRKGLNIVGSVWNPFRISWPGARHVMIFASVRVSA